VAHPERPLHGLAGHRERLGQDVVEGLLEPGVLALAAVGLQLAATLEVGVVALVVGRLIGLGGLEDLGLELGEMSADLLVGECLVLGFERVRLVDQGEQASDLAVVRVDESVQESGTPEYRRGCVRARLSVRCRWPGSRSRCRSR
jgi:hypothetical protein